MKQLKLERLPKRTLIALARAYARNWQTLDGLWFQNVEAECGLEVAVRLDLKNWEKQARIEAERLKEALGIEKGGLTSVLTVLSFMSWQLVSPLFEIEEESSNRVVFCYRHCPVQEARKKKGKPEFPCKNMKLTLLSEVASVVEPKAKVRCIFCPPDPRSDEVWCKWELALGK